MKNTSSETIESGVKSKVPSDRLAAARRPRSELRAASVRPVSSARKSTAIEALNTSRAANDVRMAVPTRPSKPSGLTTGSIIAPMRPMAL